MEAQWVESLPVNCEDFPTHRHVDPGVIAHIRRASVVRWEMEAGESGSWLAYTVAVTAAQRAPTSDKVEVRADAEVIPGPPWHVHTHTKEQTGSK